MLKHRGQNTSGMMVWKELQKKWDNLSWNGIHCWLLYLTPGESGRQKLCFRDSTIQRPILAQFPFSSFALTGAAFQWDPRQDQGLPKANYQHEPCWFFRSVDTEPLVCHSKLNRSLVFHQSQISFALLSVRRDSKFYPLKGQRFIAANRINSLSSNKLSCSSC